MVLNMRYHYNNFLATDGNKTNDYVVYNEHTIEVKYAVGIMLI